MNLSLCVKNYLLSNHVSFNCDNSPSRWVLFSSFHKWGNWDSKFKLAETSCLQLIEWDLNPGLPNSDVRMVSGNVSTKEGLSPLAFKTSNSQKVSQPFPASPEWGLAGCYNLSICCVWLAAQLCLTLCDPMDGSPPGSSVHWILQARILEWLPFPPPGDLPNPGIKPSSPALQVDSLPTEPPGKPSVPSQLTFSTVFASFTRWRIATVLRWAYSLFCVGWNQLLGSI